MSSSNIPPSDLYVLILRLLESDSRLASGFSALRDDLEAAGLLGTSVDWMGASHTVSYERASRRMGPPPNAAQLSHLLSRLVEFTRAREPAETRLHNAPWSLLRSGRQSLAPPAVSTPGSRHAAASAEPPSSSQWSATYRKPLALSTEVGVRRRLPQSRDGQHRGGGGLMPLAIAARSLGVRLPSRLRPPRLQLSASCIETPGISCAMRPLATIIGHRSPVYCCLFDMTGSLLFTGSDDHNVKIWCVQTGYLQHTCRGHLGEIAEMDVSPCNKYLVRAHKARTRSTR